MLKGIGYYAKLFRENTLLNWSDISFPFTLNQVRKSEKQNPSIALTIIGFDEDIHLKRNEEEEVHTAVDEVIDSVVGQDEDGEGLLVESRYMSDKKLLKSVRLF